MKAQHAKVTHRGAHPGNDTIWRMVVDLYKALRTRERKYFTVIDGILAGEGQGPFCPSSKHANVLIGGRDFLLTDIVATRYKGIIPEKIKYLEYFIREWNIDLARVPVWMDGKPQEGFFRRNTQYADSEVPESWAAIKSGR